MSPIVTITKGLLVKEIDNELCVYDSRNKRIHTLNKTAAFLWKLCQDSTNVDQIREMFLEKYEVSEEQVSKDIEAILSKLEKSGLISIESKDL